MRSAFSDMGLAMITCNLIGGRLSDSAGVEWQTVVKGCVALGQHTCRFGQSAVTTSTDSDARATVTVSLSTAATARGRGLLLVMRLVRRCLAKPQRKSVDTMIQHRTEEVESLCNAVCHSGGVGKGLPV